jgi:O-acetyl-ADP-ribose deacetylase (regulator of RNase III)
MIALRTGDILADDAEALVNTVNCVGVMGRGIALQFKKAFPENYKAYERACEASEVQPGRMLPFDTGRLRGTRYVINFPTKRHWKGKSKIEDIESGLAALVEDVKALGIRSIAVPPLGCGLGGLEWRVVRPMIERAFAALPEVDVRLYEPAGAPVAEDMVKTKEPPGMTPGRAALVGLVRRYLAAVMDPFVTLLEIHKLMYFMQEAGEPLRLEFEKGRYGPYAKNLRHVLSAVEGHFITGYGDAEDDPLKPIELNEEALPAAEAKLNERPETAERFARVARGIEGFESTYGMELLATVHWVANHERAVSAETAVASVHGWNERKQMFPPEHIVLAYKVLRDRGWIEPAMRRGDGAAG